MEAQPYRFKVHANFANFKVYSANLYGPDKKRVAHIPAVASRTRDEFEALALRLASLPVLEAERLELVSALEMAESFIAGFEHDDTQDVSRHLHRLRHWISHVRGGQA